MALNIAANILTRREYNIPLLDDKNPRIAKPLAYLGGFVTTNHPYITPKPKPMVVQIISLVDMKGK